jgi:molybdopterin synthase sulfur carrier subunit
MSDDAAKVTIRLWAGARAAAGVDVVEVEVTGPVAVGHLAAEVVRRSPGGQADPGRVARVLEVCSVLVGDRPLGAADRDEARVEPASTVEFLPPFAGG